MNKKAALITGASSEIGRAVIQSIAADYDCVIAHYHQNGASLESLGLSNVLAIQADLGTELGVEELKAFTRTKCAAPCAIVHLAALPLELRRFSEFDWAHFSRDLDIQLKSITSILKEFLPLMAKREEQSKVVLMVSSVSLSCSASLPPKFMSGYTISKFALLGLMKATAAEYADKRININAVSPSMVETQFLRNIPKKAIEIAAAQNPTQRNARPEDIVPAIRFLLSRDSDFISGHNLPITAGAPS
jgi:3-oxoacyl-[acyl-carrier protein] reductase